MPAVLHTVGSLAPDTGGPARTVPGLCAGLQEAGLSVVIATLSAGDRKIVGDVPVEVHDCGSLRFGGFVRELCLEHEIEIIHDHGVWLLSNHLVARAAQQLGLPRVVSPRGMLEPWAIQHHGWKKKLAWWLYQKRDLQRSNLLHATAEMEAANLRTLGLNPPIGVIPNAVDVPEDVIGDPEHGCPGTLPRTALFLSRVHPKKGLLNLVEAWSRIRPDGWRMVVAGPDEGGHRDEVMAAAEEKGIRDDFAFPGRVSDEDKWDLLAEADLFVLPTFSENFGIVVAEALAAGVPAITTRGAPWQPLKDAGCGWWIDIGVDALARTLGEAMARSDAERREMGRRGQKLVRTEFLWPAVARKMADVYEWMLEDGVKPECVL